ncbi:hypothetical protein M0R72_18095 [Candidatus Pacearchaeota archaeon]|jgi:hypothetical protein|nr:hypothetical protein [Candidatus Pacearchaeota archaeon]
MAKPTCIDLTELCGKKYKIEYEESYYAQYGPNAHVNDPWYKIVPCQKGHFFPWGGNRIAFATKGNGPICRILRDLPGVEVMQDGSDGINVAFDVSMFDQIAQLVIPRKKRQVSDEERQRLADMSAKYSPLRISERQETV